MRLLPPGTPRRVRRLVARCLDKDPRTRLQDIGEARIALSDANPEDDLEPAASRPARQRGIWAFGGLMIGALAALVVLHGSARPPPRNPLYWATWRRLTDSAGTKLESSIPPDGRWVAFIANTDGPFDLFVGQIGYGHFVNRSHGQIKNWLPSPRGVGFNADGTAVWLSGGIERQMEFTPLQGGNFQMLLADKDAVSVAWSRDGSKIAYHSNLPGDPIYVTAPHAVPGKPILRGDPGFHQHFPTWSVDDQWIFLVRGREATGDMNLWRMRPNGKQLEQLTYGLKWVAYPTPIDEKTVMFLACEANGAGPSIWALDLPSGMVRRGNIGLEHFQTLSASRDGTRLLATVTNPKVGLWTVPVGNRPAVEADVKPLDGTMPLRALAPRLRGEDLFFLSSLGTGDGLWRRRGQDLLELWPGPQGLLLWPQSISPDGRHVALVKAQGERMNLYVLNTDGSGGLRVLSPELDVRGSSAWSPNGKWIVIGGGPSQKGLYKVPASGGRPVRLADGDALDPVWSPRKDWIVYAGKQVDAISRLRAVDPDGNVKPLPDIQVRIDGERCRFLPDGSGLVYMQGLNLAQDFYLLDLSTMKARRLTHFDKTDSMRTFDVAPDGKSLVFDRESANSDIVLIELPKKRAR